ncbi:MAG TPA: BON domain-containing protein [Usitatibacter sp.]|nr:BON domain-containing protein [Usitatibacter sp.]
MNFRIPAILAASLAVSAFGAVNATDAVKQTSHGSQGDFTASDEGKSTMPVPPAPIATVEKGPAIADDQLASTIARKLNGDTSLKGSKIKVMAANRDVTLSGSVKDQSQSQKAESDVKSMVKGTLTNSLTAAG